MFDILRRLCMHACVSEKGCCSGLIRGLPDQEKFTDPWS